ncbi:MAG: dihydroorotate dehydrogenase [Planctomycetota bacterium]|nr:dihydroorotate dehydrogenase [Planctomycetota bacterium]
MISRNARIRYSKPICPIFSPRELNMDDSIDLATTVGHFRFKNPIILASGTYGYGRHPEKIPITPLINKLGGFITKTITLKERKGNPPPRIVETAAGIINSVGLENPGIERFCRDYLDEIARIKTVRIISIGGSTADEITQTIRTLQRYKYKIFDGIEINISCPNVEKGGACIAQNPDEVKKTVKRVLKISRLPIIVKLSPNVTDITAIARSALSAGAEVLSLINTVSAMSIDWRGRKSMLGGFSGGLSGPAIKPIALKMVHQVASKTKAEVIGIGGIMNAEDVLDFLCAGAKAVQIGTLNLTDPFAVFEIQEQLKNILSKERIKSVREFVLRYQLSTSVVSCSVGKYKPQIHTDDTDFNGP